VAQDNDNPLTGLVRTRLLQNKQEIQHSLKQIAAGNPLGSEKASDRSVRRISAKTGLSAGDSEALSNMIAQAAAQIDRGRAPKVGPEALRGPTIDFVGVEFFLRGRMAANAVGRVVFKSGKAEGTGFLVGPGMFLTNNHVIGSAIKAKTMLVEFDYESDRGSQRPVTAFEFAPDRCFVTDDFRALDYTLIAVGPRTRGEKSIDGFGYLPLSDAADKHMLGEIANIIQHPKGSLKQIVIRENNLVARDETNQVLHYLADTDNGSSGSPVCNNDWEPVALHHWGGPGLELKDINGQPLRQDINEGVRISAVVRSLRSKVSSLDAAMAATVRQLLSVWEKAHRGPVNAENFADRRGNNNSGGPTIGADGSISWTIPIEISVRSPLSMAQPLSTPQIIAPPPGEQASGAERASTEFNDRGGYEPGFIPGFSIPLPKLDRLPYPVAPNREAARGDDPHELRYHHFSIYMNAERKLAAVTAVNIDGKRLYAINRSDKTAVKATTPSDLGVESLGAESSDDFQPDPRVGEDQMAIEYYQDQNVPGYAKPQFPGTGASKKKKSEYAKAMSQRTARMFQKGHIVLRGDPAWGTKPEAVAAEADTFFYTNAAPQLGFFNQGSAENRPGSKGKLRWRALESYILRNALTMQQRVCVFAGPIFDDEYDLPYRQNSLIPMRFFKIAVWAEEGGLRSIALLADQKPVFDLTEGIPEGAEGYVDSDELARVSEFLSTVKEIETLTKLDFGAAVRAADVRAGRRASPAIEAEASVLSRARKPAATASAKKKTAKNLRKKKARR
jgi:endonuclease G